MIEFTVNGQTVTSESEADTPLLWVIRDELKLKGTKYGCGIAMCGVCNVHIDGVVARSCITPVSSVAGKSITTIEGLDSAEGESLKQAWVAEQVPQCGYCQSGQVMSAVALLADNPVPTDADIDAAMSGNICRCGTYPRIRRGIKKASAQMTAQTGSGEKVNG